MRLHVILFYMRDPILMTVIDSRWLALGLNVGRLKSREAVVLTLLIHELLLLLLVLLLLLEEDRRSGPKTREQSKSPIRTILRVWNVRSWSCWPFMISICRNDFSIKSGSFSMILLRDTLPWCILIGRLLCNDREWLTWCVATRKMVIPMVDEKRRRL